MTTPGNRLLVFADLLREVDALLPQTPDGMRIAEREHADVVADLLRFLAQRMTDLYRERQEEIDAFLAWLEQAVGCRIDDLNGRSHVRRYHEVWDDPEPLLRVLERNHPARVQADVAAPAEYGATNPVRDRIADAFRTSLAKLRPIRQQIELTDALIDRVVYRLYGLTSDQVALVEGEGTRTS